MRALSLSRLLGPVVSSALALLVVACGDSTGPAASRNQGGFGTQTLRVDAEIQGQDVPGGFTTAFLVSLRDAAGNPVSGATVTVKNQALGTVNLLEFAAGSGDYQASANLFASGDYRLDVNRGTDHVTGVVVGGMSVHQIIQPTANGIIAANQPFTVTWTRPSEATGADLETRDFTAGAIPDAGSYIIPGASNPARPDQRIRVWRHNQVDIAGGLPGSSLQLSIRNTVEPVVVQ